MPVDNPNVGVAFALVCGAGAATALGASVVFFPSLVKLASRRVLAAALGVSAGVMTYVSFVEIFNKSLGSFIDAGHTEERAYLYATLCFFGGVVAMLLVDFAVRCISGDHHHHHHHHDLPGDGSNAHADSEQHDEAGSVVVPHCIGCSDDPVGELEEWQHRAEEEEKEREREETVASNPSSRGGGASASSADNDAQADVDGDDADTFEDNDRIESGKGEGLKAPADAAGTQQSRSVSVAELNSTTNAGTLEGQNKVTVDMAHRESKKLVRMGINTALAIGIHNFPEGLATFVAALDDPGVGAVLAIAIGIHNIPEGLCVALPIYYATGNRWKAFLWACMSGLSEPIGALLGWAVLANSMSDNLYAILFGIVGGMMVIISTKELLPTAHRYDPEDTVVTYSMIVGMVIMALSLVLFMI